MAAIHASPSSFQVVVETVIDEDMHHLETLFFRVLDGESSIFLSTFIENRCLYSDIEHKKVFKFFDIALLFAAEATVWETALKIISLTDTKAFSKGNFLRVFTLAIDSNQREFLNAMYLHHRRLLTCDQRILIAPLVRKLRIKDGAIVDV